MFATMMSHLASNNKSVCWEFHSLTEDTVTKIAKTRHVTCFDLINIFYEGLPFLHEIYYPT